MQGTVAAVGICAQVQREHKGLQLLFCSFVLFCQKFGKVENWQTVWGNVKEIYLEKPRKWHRDARQQLTYQ